MRPKLPENAPAEFELLETMKVSTGGAVDLLPRHLERLHGSARYFGFACDPAELHRAVAAEASRQVVPAMLRLLLFRDGRHQLQVKPLPPAGRSSLSLSPITVDSADTFLRHKTTARGIYERARAGSDDDVLLANQRGEVTETTIANIAVLRNGHWITPLVSCGLLPGIMRAHLLAEGQLMEGMIRLDELSPGETIRCFNAVRGVFDVRFREPNAKI